MIRIAPERPFPGQPCAACAGRAVQWDRHREAYRPCPHCAGLATVGVFTVRVSNCRYDEHELNWHTTDAIAAFRRARWVARLLARINPDTPAERVAVVYRTTTPGSAGQGGDGATVYTAHVLRVAPAGV